MNKTLFDGQFTLVQTRLRGGAVYVNADKTEYLRIGDKQQTAEEEIHTVSLFNKGFPVAKVLRHGELDDKWYFVESSLGEKPLGHMFAEEYSKYGEIQQINFDQYMKVMTTYAQASFGKANRQAKSENLRDIAMFDGVKSQVDIDQALFERCMVKAESQLRDAPVAMINTDLGPYNSMPGGIIDFEFLHNGPIGYDLITAPSVGYHFPKISGYHYKLTYQFTTEQLSSYYDMVHLEAEKAGISFTADYRNACLFMKTIWLTHRPFEYANTAYESENQERFWSTFRPAILRHVITAYDVDEPIDFTKFPEVGLEA